MRTNGYCVIKDLKNSVIVNVTILFLQVHEIWLLELIVRPPLGHPIIVDLFCVDYATTTTSSNSHHRHTNTYTHKNISQLPRLVFAFRLVRVYESSLMQPQ